MKKIDITILREKFIRDFCAKKGWKKENLSPSQMHQLVNQIGYKNPKIN